MTKRGNKASLTGFGIGHQSAEHSVVIFQRSDGVDQSDQNRILFDYIGTAEKHFSQFYRVRSPNYAVSATHEGFVRNS